MSAIIRPHGPLYLRPLQLTLCGFIPLVIMLSRWFVRRRATAIGVSLMIGPIAGLVITPLIAWSVDPDAVRPGWRLTAFAVAGIIACVAALAFLKMRNRPEDMDLSPDGNQARKIEVQSTNFTLSQVLHSRVLWLLVAADVLVSQGILAPKTFLGLRMLDAGLNSSLFSMVGLVEIAVSVPFYLVGRLVGDRVPKRAALSSFAALQAVGVFVMAFADSLPVFILAVTLTGMGTGALAPLIWAILPDYFGLTSLGKVLGFFLLFTALSILFPFTAFVGWSIDIYGSYIVFFMASGGLTLLGSCLFSRARPPLPPASDEHQAQLP